MKIAELMYKKSTRGIPVRAESFECKNGGCNADWQLRLSGRCLPPSLTPSLTSSDSALLLARRTITAILFFPFPCPRRRTWPPVRRGHVTSVNDKLVPLNRIKCSYYLCNSLYKTTPHLCFYGSGRAARGELKGVKMNS